MGAASCVRGALVALGLIVVLLASRERASAQCGPDDRGWFGGGLTRVYGNASNYCIANIGTRIARLNTTNPASVTIDWQTGPLSAVYFDNGIDGRLNDLAVGNGLVYVTVADDLYVYNLATGAQVAVHPNLGSAVATFGTTLYIADFYNLRILNMTDPTLPLEVSRTSLSSPASSATPTSIAFSGNRLYVAAGDFLNESEVVAFDISNPAAPQRLGAYVASNSQGFSPTVSVALNFVLFTPGNTELLVLDFSNAAAPAVRSTLTGTSRLAHTRVSGNLFWIAAGAEGVKTYNLGAAGGLTLRGTYNTPGFAERLAGSQPFFVADREGGLQLLNITSGSTPTFVGAYATNEPGMVRDMDTQGSITYVLDNNALRLYSDLFHLINPPLVRGTFSGLTQPYRVRVSGRTTFYAYIADGGGGLKIVNVTNPDAPALTGSLGLGGTATHVTLGNAVYVTTAQTGIRIIDVSTITAPTLRATATIPNATQYRGVASNGQRIYVCTNLGMSVINVTNPAAPAFERTFADPDGFSECLISGNYLYCGKANYPGGFTIYDITNPALPTLLRTYDLSINGVVDMELAGTLLSVTAYSGVYIFDVADPAQPAFVSGVGSPWPEDYDDARNMLMVDIAPGGTICYAQSERGLHFASAPTGWAPTSREPFVSARRCLHDSYFFSTNLSANPSTGLTYQWTKNDVPIPGATGPTYSLTNLRGVDRGLYSCIATNACGSREGSWVQLTICPADLDDGSGTGQCDGGVTVEDLLFFLVIFEDGNPIADLDDGSNTGTPDGGVTIDDLLYFLARYNAGC